ncbi:MAG: hypothetical protein ACHP9W_00440 [Steroidobacterales bacterium]
MRHLPVTPRHAADTCAGNLLGWYESGSIAHRGSLAAWQAILARFTRQANGSAMALAAYVMSAAVVALLTMPFFERRRAAAGTAASQVPA